MHSHAENGFGIRYMVILQEQLQNQGYYNSTTLLITDLSETFQIWVAQNFTQNGDFFGQKRTISPFFANYS